jgi:nucleotide-binding universal stress UspA family protein
LPDTDKSVTPYPSNGEKTVYQRILVPTDGSDTANAGLREACKLAGEEGAQLRLIHVVDELLGISPQMYGVAYEQIIGDRRNAGTRILTDAESVAREAGVNVETRLVEAMGSAAGEQVIHAAQEWPADLIVCGTHGRRGLRRIVMGSDAEYIVRHASVPVLLIRRDGR